MLRVKVHTQVRRVWVGQSDGVVGAKAKPELRMVQGRNQPKWHVFAKLKTGWPAHLYNV
jgi:hypothetical protein